MPQLPTYSKRNATVTNIQQEDCHSYQHTARGLPQLPTYSKRNATVTNIQQEDCHSYQHTNFANDKVSLQYRSKTAMAIEALVLVT